jgi:hypothetical protein
VLGTEHVERFLNGGRALTSVLSVNNALRQEFTEKFGDQYQTVRDYYLARGNRVKVEDISRFVPELVEQVDHP